MGQFCLLVWNGPVQPSSACASSRWAISTSPSPPTSSPSSPPPSAAGSRLLDGRGAGPVDRIFRELPQLLQPGDLLVFNDTQVMKARLYGEKPTGGKLELLVERVLAGREIAAHMKVSKKPLVGTALHMDGGFTATLLGRWPDQDGPLFRFALSDDPYALMERHGHVPLPPYITHADSAEDARRYQTVFARNPGAVAAPTAALHFDEELLAALDAKGIQRASVTLHVGAGTFQPVKTEDIAQHRMHSEWYEVPQATQQAITRLRERGGRLVAVGTTTVRTLESWARSGQASGDTDIFITPGFDFRQVDLLLTNFHLPRSTLLMLVSAFAGYEHIMQLYRHAVESRYRFFSYGDAMLLARTTS
jgi:S-adenosylmethionine:tRNA ribosyltransferase-isomerase